GMAGALQARCREARQIRPPRRQNASRHKNNPCQHDDLAGQKRLSPSKRRPPRRRVSRSEEHTSELQSHLNLVCRLLLEKKTTRIDSPYTNPAGTAGTRCPASSGSAG